MKKLLFLGLSVAAITIGCNNETKTTSQAGVYKLDKAAMTDGKTETVNLASDGNVQYKIYTPEAYFYIGMGKDSSAGFGVGSYTQTGNTITESNIYNTASMDTAWDVKLEITGSEKGYSQLIPEMKVNGSNYKLTEDYTKVTATGTSPLDGVWKQTKFVLVTGKDSADKTYNEYKVYSAGHFMWGTRYLSDSATKKFTNLVGHGTFTLNNDALTEQLDFASMKGLTGKYDIKVKFNGADEYTQETADTATKSVGFKTYKRVKK